MILSRAPFRISLNGGGTDIPSYFQEFDGEVYSFAIDKYVYVALHDHFPGGIRIKYSKSEEVNTVDEIQHPLIREILLKYNLQGPLEIASFADVPSSGTGLGSSSSFTVAMINATLGFLNKSFKPGELAEAAVEIEIVKCKEPIGKQDQFAASFGGINHFKFLKNGETKVIPSSNFVEDKEFLDSTLSLFYLGFGRSASDILREQTYRSKSDESAIENLHLMKDLVNPTKEAVRLRDSRALGELILEGWKLKTSLSTGVSNSTIDDLILKSLSLGAYGAKVVGAGGGGFLLICHEPGLRSFFSSKLDGLRILDFKIAPEGAQIVYSDENKEQTNS